MLYTSILKISYPIVIRLLCQYYTMQIREHIDKLPRYSLALVFIIFGIDKFVNQELLIGWLNATARVRMLLPTDDLSLAVYAIGIIEIVIAVVLFIGFKHRYTSIAAGIWLISIMVMAQYPSSLPQDLGLLGLVILLASNKKYDWVVRYSLALVLILWAADQGINYDRHLGWISIASYIGKVVDANLLIYPLIAVEVILASLYAYGRVKYAFLAGIIFFAIAKSILEPPLNNYQSIAFLLTSAWLFIKNKV